MKAHTKVLFGVVLGGVLVFVSSWVFAAGSGGVPLGISGCGNHGEGIRVCRGGQSAVGDLL